MRDLGLITIDTGANGRRSGRPLSDGRRLGINFAPLLDRVAQLLELRKAAQARLLRLRQLRLECSAARRSVRDLLAAESALSPDELAEIDARKALWPDRYTHLRTGAALTALLNDILDVERRLLEAKRTANSSAASAQILPPVQNTISSKEGTCTEAGIEKSRLDLNRRALGPAAAKDEVGFPGRVDPHVGLDAAVVLADCRHLVAEAQVGAKGVGPAA